MTIPAPSHIFDMTIPFQATPSTVTETQVAANTLPSSLENTQMAMDLVKSIDSQATVVSLEEDANDSRVPKAIIHNARPGLPSHMTHRSSNSHCSVSESVSSRPYVTGGCDKVLTSRDGRAILQDPSGRRDQSTAVYSAFDAKRLSLKITDASLSIDRLLSLTNNSCKQLKNLNSKLEEDMALKAQDVQSGLLHLVENKVLPTLKEVQANVNHAINANTERFVSFMKEGAESMKLGIDRVTETTMRFDEKFGGCTSEFKDLSEKLNRNCHEHKTTLEHLVEQNRFILENQTKLMGQFTSQSRSIEAVLSRLQQLETIVNDYHTAIPSVSSEPDSAAPANDGTAKICSVVEIPSGQRLSYFENRTAFDSKSINLTADPKTEDKKKICKPFTLVSIKNHRGFGSKTADQHTKTEKSVILALQSTNRKKSTESAIIDKANDSSSATLLSPPPMAVNSVLPSKVVRGTTYLHNHQPTAPSTSKNNLGESKSTVQLSNQTIEEYSCSPLPWEIDSPPKVETPRKVDSAIQPVIPPNSKKRVRTEAPADSTKTSSNKMTKSRNRGRGRGRRNH